MRRVHRNLSRAEIEALRLRLTELVPVRGGSIRQVMRMMRLITRKSQSEYARMCGVAPRVLAAVEAGTGSPTVETLEKLSRPFGFRVGIVRIAEGWDSTDEETSELEETPGTKTVESALTRALRKSRSKAE
jgi:putative transcriptional regulator